ncbi:MAG TPA: DUF58 domain-containing protein [Trebonia sp.]|nr:DUF58 domain-containing protein [Trebonia sp.]
MAAELMSTPAPASSAPVPTAPERLLLRLEWRVLRRLEGRLAGGYRTAHRGAGTDLAGLREYAEGDDARHIDWNVTARLNEPHLRLFNEDRELIVWLVLDRSASMAVGLPGRGKHDVLSELAVVLARMFSRGGNNVGALLYDNGAVRRVPPGTGRRHVLRIAAELSRTAGPDGRPVREHSSGPGRRGRGRDGHGKNGHGENGYGENGHGQNGRRGSGQHRGTTDLAAMLDAVAKLARRRSLIIVISDFIGAGDWERSLLRLGPRHEVVALRIVDAADDELPEAGLLVVEDAETGEQLVLDSGDTLLRDRLRAAVEERDASLAAGMRRAGVPVHRISTDADLATALVEVVASTRRRRA